MYVALSTFAALPSISSITKIFNFSSLLSVRLDFNHYDETIFGITQFHLGTNEVHYLFHVILFTNSLIPFKNMLYTLLNKCIAQDFGPIIEIKNEVTSLISS